MKPYAWVAALLLGTLIASPALASEKIDGTRPLLVSIIRVMECTLSDGCADRLPEEVGLPRFFVVDFARKVIAAAGLAEKTPPSLIERQEVVEGKLILQGAESGYENIHDGLGWTMAISQDDGQVVVTASGQQVAFVLFGAALPR